MHLVLRFHFVTLLLLTIFAISRHCRYNLNVLIYFQCILIFIFYRSCGLIQIKMMMMMMMMIECTGSSYRRYAFIDNVSGIVVRRCGTLCLTI